MSENDPLLKSVQKAVAVAMENIAFEEPELLDGPVGIPGETVAFSLQVVSPYLLLARVIMQKELAARLAAIIYRDDEGEITDALVDDTVGEFLNTIIGTMMGDLTLGERIFEMGLPVKLTGKLEDPEGHAKKIFFRIEGLPFCIEIYGEVFV